MKQNPVRKLQGENRIVGLQMTPAETENFFKTLGKKVLTFFGYSVDYEHEAVMLAQAREMLSKYSPQTYLINIGATAGGIGAVYPIAKAMGFQTTGIVSSVATKHMNYISRDVDHVCFVADTQWGGKLPDTNELSPTSKAMVSCSDILVAIGGGEVSRDELLEGRKQGKPIFFYPAEISHEYWIEHARKQGMPAPASFAGAVHETFGDSHPK